MISDVKNFPISTLFDLESKVVYNIPRYQREYTWSRFNWEALFDDVIESDGSYFLGSIICINQSTDAYEVQELELVDGQQRLTTISLLFLALYACLKDHEADLDDEQRVELINLKNRLMVKKTERLRVNPQHQNSNNEDFRNLYAELGLLKKLPKPRNAGNRRIHKCFWFFKERFQKEVETEPKKVDALIALLSKFQTATLVKIQVATHADAYTLFESLNNRGVPLTPIDIIKNKLLAELERRTPDSVDSSFDRWQELLEYLGDDYAVQERFFRQYYNAFKFDLATTIEVPLATKSNIIRIYEQLIHKDPAGTLDRILDAGRYTALILGRSKDDDLIAKYAGLEHQFKRLERVQSAPSYLLLSHLFHGQERYQLTQAHFASVIGQIVSFFARRSVTDLPPTYDLTRLFMSIVDQIRRSHEKESSIPPMVGDSIERHILSIMAAEAASDALFRERLSGPIYDEKGAATRFILCALEEDTMTKETWKDLWKQDGKLYTWTIEHIFPQGANIPQSWMQMMASGDAAKAKEIQTQHVHRLGNLTISGYNSALGNKSFLEKRDRLADGKPVGYRNGLSLNAELATAETWSVEQIEARTQKLVESAVELFRMR